MEIVGKKSQGLSVTTLSEDKTAIISFNDRSLNFLYLKYSILTHNQENGTAKSNGCDW